MQSNGQRFLLVLFLLNAVIGPTVAQNSVLRIVNPRSDTLLYCSDSVAVAPEITIENIVVDKNTDGMKVSIVNYKQGEDRLVYDTVTNLNYNWNDSQGSLEIKGIGTPEEYQRAVRQVYYKNLANVPTLNVRTFSISLLDADYLPRTEHFYRNIPHLDITWKEAKAAADTMTYYGLKGYLATITTQEENDFIWSKVSGFGWIGASDEETEGVWKWVTGPEAGTQFWQGTHGNNGWAIAGRYSFWSSGEPNNAGPEHYAHINQNPAKAHGSWNDLRNEGDGVNSTYYRAQGFLVEFGGLEGEPKVQVSATATIKISKIAFSDQRELGICVGESVSLNVKASDEYKYSWTPDENINSASVSNPVVFPGSTTTYRAIGKLDACVDTAFFKVTVNPLPVSLLKTEYALCPGASVTLDGGKYQSYLWSTGEETQTIQVKTEGRYRLKIENEWGCSTIDSTFVDLNEKPKLDYDKIDTLICGSKKHQLTLSFENETPSILLSTSNPNALVENGTTLSPTVSVADFGAYEFVLTITNQNNCTFLDTLKIEFHNQPTAEFFNNDEKCSGYNLELKHLGETVEPAIFSWYSNDTVFASGTGLDSIIIPLGYGIRERTVALKVNEQGCIAEKREPVSVVPKMNFWVEENAEGCQPLTAAFGNEDVEEIESYAWDFGDGLTSSEKNPSHRFENLGTTDKRFDVTLAVTTTEGCKNTGTLYDTITVHPVPTIDLDFDEDFCYTEKAQVSYLGSGNPNDQYIWDLSEFDAGEIVQDPGISDGPLEFIRSSQPTVEIRLKVISEFGCATDQISKTWKRKPVYDVGIDNMEGCPPLEVAFSAQTTDKVDQLDYSWDFGDGNSAQEAAAVHRFTQANKKHNIRAFVTSTLTNCVDTFLLPNEIFVFPQPVAAFSADPASVLISDPVVQFANESTGAAFYEWDFDDGTLLSDEPSPAHSFAKMGFYDVVLAAYNDYNCVDTTTQQVLVAFDKIFPPTAFSPNAPLEEDREFRLYSEGIAGEGYRLLIFNRWGEKLFDSTNQNTGWDGKMKNGNFAPSGVYTWTLHYSDFRGEKHKQQGTVTLLF